MNDNEWVVQHFEANRAHLEKIALRMLGSQSEAEDAVQETWLRLSRSDAGVIDNLGGWLTTVVARICLDVLRSRRSRREESLDAEPPAQAAAAASAGPEQEALLADSIGPALLVILDRLSPPERVAFVLHDMFGMPFEEIAPIVGRTQAAARQLASRARRRVRSGGDRELTHRQSTKQQGGAAASSGGRRESQNAPGERKRTERRIVDAFLAAARSGDFESLLSLLDPDCVVSSDEYATLIGSPRRIAGGRNVADFFNGAASSAVRATIHGEAGAAWAPHGRVRVAFGFSFRGDRIAGIEFIADRNRIRELGVELLDG